MKNQGGNKVKKIIVYGCSIFLLMCTWASIADAAAAKLSVYVPWETHNFSAKKLEMECTLKSATCSVLAKKKISLTGNPSRHDLNAVDIVTFNGSDVASGAGVECRMIVDGKPDTKVQTKLTLPGKQMRCNGSAKKTDAASKKGHYHRKKSAVKYTTLKSSMKKCVSDSQCRGSELCEDTYRGKRCLNDIHGRCKNALDCPSSYPMCNQKVHGCVSKSFYSRLIAHSGIFAPKGTDGSLNSCFNDTECSAIELCWNHRCMTGAQQGRVCKKQKDCGRYQSCNKDSGVCNSSDFYRQFLMRRGEPFARDGLLGSHCSIDALCASGHCANGICAPKDGTGMPGVYCHHDNHCASKQCNCKKDTLGALTGFCKDYEKHPGHCF